jgi:hypothetical protein
VTHSLPAAQTAATQFSCCRKVAASCNHSTRRSLPPACSPDRRTAHLHRTPSVNLPTATCQDTAWCRPQPPALPPLPPHHPTYLVPLHSGRSTSPTTNHQPLAPPPGPANPHLTRRTSCWHRSGRCPAA